jgi:hypothetical protein
VSFGALEKTKTVRVSISGDNLAEGNETFVLKLSSPVGAVIADDDGLATVVDEEGPLALSVADVSVFEGGPGATATATFTVSLSAAPGPGQTVSLRAATGDGSATAGSDYTGVGATTLSFGPGERVKTVPVEVMGDSLAEANEAFGIDLFSAVGAVISDPQGLATIVNDE